MTRGFGCEVILNLWNIFISLYFQRDAKVIKQFITKILMNKKERYAQSVEIVQSQLIIVNL